MKKSNQHPLGITIDGPEWALAWTDEWRPLLLRYRAELEWLLDMATAAAHQLPSERAAVSRVRGALRQLVDGFNVRVAARDLMFTAALLLAALERDLGPLRTRPLRFRREDLLIEMVGNYVAHKVSNRKKRRN